MTEVVFNFNGIQNVIQCQPKDSLKDICQKYLIKIDKKRSDIVFIYNGNNQLKEELTFEEHANKMDKERNKMNILVYEISSDPQDEKINQVKQTKQVLCPECDENIKIKIENYKVKLFDCKNGHKSIKLLSEFNKLLNVDESKIICDLCKNAKKSETYKNIFYYCYTCKIKFCPLCKSNHEKNEEHKIVEYDLRNYNCQQHNEPYNSYCEKCQKNICIKCIEEHNDHEIINYQSILPKIDDKLNELKQLKDKIDRMTEFFNEFIHILKETIKNSELLYDIQMNIINNYNIKNLNYELLYNIKEIDNNYYFQDINKIIDAIPE